MRLKTLMEARWILALFALLAIATLFVSAWLSLLFFLLFLCTVAFFRDPERMVPADPNLIVAAADGTVMDIVELDESHVLRQSMAALFIGNIEKGFVSMHVVRIVPRRTNR